MKIIAIAALSILFSLAAHSASALEVQQTPKDIELEIGKHAIPHSILVTVTGEYPSLDAFAEALTPLITEMTANQKAEVCGILAQGEKNTFSVILGTTHARIACVNIPGRIIDGHENTGFTIHSHPKGNAIRLTQREVALLRAIDGAEYRAGEVMRGGSPEKFSIADLRNGAGYLVTGNGRLLKYEP